MKENNYIKNIVYENEEKSFMISHNEVSGFSSMPKNHTHNFYEIYFLLSGVRNYFIQNRLYVVSKGDLVLINPHILHKTIDAGIKNHQRILINFNSNFVDAPNGEAKKLLNEIFNKENFITSYTLKDQEYIEKLLIEMLNEFSLKQYGYMISIKALLLKLLVHIKRTSKFNDLSLYENKSTSHRKVSKILDYINENATNPISLKHLSNKFYISKFYLSRIFKESTGFSVVEYINILRIKKAQKLLRQTNEKIIDISEKTGFGSISHFGRTFKNITGTSPLKYRKNKL